MINNQLTPAAFKFLGAIYETAVDKGLNLVEVQSYLKAKGIHKPLLAIRHDLDEVFCFHGYSASHPAPPRLSYEQIDALIVGKKINCRATQTPSRP